MLLSKKLSYLDLSSFVDLKIPKYCLEPPLFKISKSGGDFFILGSCHWIDIHIFSQDILNIFQNCPCLILESDTVYSKEYFLQILKEAGIYRPDLPENNWLQTLPSQIKEKILNLAKGKICQFLESDFKYMDTSIIYLLLHAYYSLSGMDQQLETFFSQNSREIFYLEGNQELSQKYILTLQEICRANKIHYKSSYELEAKIHEMMLELSQIRLDIYAKYSNSFFQQKCSKNQTSSFIERNLSWIDRIESISKNNQNALFTVGAAHLFGHKGLLNLLHNRGYAVSISDDKGKFVHYDMSYLSDYRHCRSMPNL